MATMLLYENGLCDRVMCPAEITENLKRYIRAFDRWLKEDGRFRFHDPEVGRYYSFGKEDVFEWFNDVVLADSDDEMFYVERDYEPSERDLRNMPVFYV